MIYSHKLTSKNKKHNSFLEEERNDPITGDKIIEGNEIVLCGACKSAFLLDSWNYMARSHCNQPFTLKEIPTKQHVVKEIEIEEEKKYKFKLNNDNETLRAFLALPSLWFSSIVFFRSMIEKNFFNRSLDIFFIAVIFFSLSIYLLAIQKNKIIFDKKKVIVPLPFGSKLVYLSKIEKLEFFDSSKDDKTVLVIMFLMNGKIKKFKIIKDKYTISEVKELQEYFEKNNLSDKISVG